MTTEQLVIVAQAVDRLALALALAAAAVMAVAGSLLVWTFVEWRAWRDSDPS